MMKKIVILLTVLLMTLPAWADDGEITRHNVSKTPDLETEHAALRMLPLYVPAQTSGGVSGRMEGGSSRSSLSTPKCS